MTGAMEGAGAWSRLPEELSDRVLSYLPLPALCRCRSVCREWNALFRKASFLDQNRGTKPYLFVTRYLSPDVHGDGWSAVDDAHQQTTCFLDLEDRRWYSIPADGAPPNDEILRLLAIDGGLFVELSSLQESYKVAVYDPVAKTRRELPASARVVCPVGETVPTVDALPVLVTAVDESDRSFKVFCMNRDATGLHSGFFVYESTTDAWRRLETPPERQGFHTSGRVLEESAVFFHGNLYAVLWYNDSNTNVVVSYNPEQDRWREVLALDAENPKYPQLVVFRDRIFIALWNIPLRPPLRCGVFQIVEILVEENLSRLVVEFPSDDLEKVSGEAQFEIAYGFPINSDCVVLISRLSGRVLTLDLRSGAVGALPAHPLQLSEQFAKDLEEHCLFPHYRARVSTLSLRNVLSCRRP